MTETQRVLVVDDEPDIRDGVSRWLQAGGYDTLAAEDGEAGVKSARQHLPHAILLDVLMPKKDGMTTLAELRSSGETAHIPVVMLSASFRDEQRALDAGAKCFVLKPYDGKKLISVVRSVIGQNARPESPTGIAGAEHFATTRTTSWR